MSLKIGKIFFLICFPGTVREYQVGGANYQLRMTYRISCGFGDIFSGIWAEGKAQRVSNELLDMYDEEDIRREAWFKTEEEEGRTNTVHQ